MKTAAFKYVKPHTIDEVFDLLEQYGPEAKLMAGGQSLIPLLHMRLAQPQVVIDLGAISSLQVLNVADQTLLVGSMVRHHRLETDPVVQETCPMLSEVAPYIAHLAIRTRGTIGGSLVHADPAAEWPVAATALDARLHIRSRAGEKVLSPDEFFLGFLMTAVEPHELLERVTFPVLGINTGWAIEEHSVRMGDFAVVLVAVVVELDATLHIQRARVVLGGVGPGPMVAHSVQSALEGTQSRSEWKAAAQRVGEDISPEDDVVASGAYRQHLAQVLVERAVVGAWSRARNRIQAGREET